MRFLLNKFSLHENLKERPDYIIQIRAANALLAKNKLPGSIIEEGKKVCIDKDTAWVVYEIER